MGTGEDSDVTVSEPKPTGKLGTSHNNGILNMFLEKTNSFYRSFLDRLYAVADLLTDRPEPKPPDSENPTNQPRMVGLVSPGRICMPGAQPGPRSGLLNTSSSA